jgi:cobalt-zinc-cadmium resistance protein CzcA
MGEGETVIGMVQMLAGENAQQVVERVKARVREIQATLPSGVTIEPYYDRTLFVSKVMQTVRNNLLEGGLLVIGVLFLFLGDLRAGLIVAAAIPLSMLIAFTGMMQAGLSGNLMSLGAIDFGLLVDGSVVMIDNILRRLATKDRMSREDRLAVVHAAGRDVLRPMTFAVGIIILVYVPILARFFSRSPQRRCWPFGLRGRVRATRTGACCAGYGGSTNPVSDGRSTILGGSSCRRSSFL